MKNLLLIISCFLVISITAQIPPSFDLRDYDGVNYVTSVKSQQGGTCWTFGSMAAMEGNLMMTGNWTNAGETGEPALAEYHLDWWNGYNEYYNSDLNPPFDNGEGLEVHMGGDYRVTTAYTSRLTGAVREIDGQSYETPPVINKEDYHHYYAQDVEWYTAGANLENIDFIKEKIMQIGAMATCMCYSDSFINADFNHYQPKSSELEPNHSVTLIGWDNDHITQAPEPGAWLVKNSWGTNWGIDGYFWISYYDKQACQNPEMGAVSFQNVILSTFDTAYYYDYHGWRDTLKYVDEAFNAFEANTDESIIAVNFFIAEQDVDYVVRVYDDFDGAALQNELTSITGNYKHSGLHTVYLPDTVQITAGDDFYVYLSLSAGGFAYDRSSEVPVLLGASSRVIVPSTASPEQSYFSDEGLWSDFYYYNDGSGFENTGNICIKALTIHDSTTAVHHYNYTKDGSYIEGNYPNPFVNSTSINYFTNEKANINISIYSVNGTLVTILVNELQQAGKHNISWNTPNNITPGMYMYNLKINGISADTKRMVIIK